MGEFLKNTFFVWLMGMLIMLKLDNNCATVVELEYTRDLSPRAQ